MSQKKNNQDNQPSKPAAATTKSCILSTSLATVNISYKSGEVYTGSILEVDRLIALNMATAVKD